MIDNEVAEANPASAHLFIVNPLHGRTGDSLFATHPQIANRIERLLAMESGGVTMSATRPSAPARATRRSSIPSTVERHKGPWG